MTKHSGKAGLSYITMYNHYNCETLFSVLFIVNSSFDLLFLISALTYIRMNEF